MEVPRWPTYARGPCSLRFAMDYAGASKLGYVRHLRVRVILRHSVGRSPGQCYGARAWAVCTLVPGLGGHQQALARVHCAGRDYKRQSPSTRMARVVRTHGRAAHIRGHSWSVLIHHEIHYVRAAFLVRCASSALSTAIRSCRCLGCVWGALPSMSMSSILILVIMLSDVTRDMAT